MGWKGAKIQARIWRNGGRDVEFLRFLLHVSLCVETKFVSFCGFAFETDRLELPAPTRADDVVQIINIGISIVALNNFVRNEDNT